MEIENLLSQKKDEILTKWFDLVIKTYPEETAKFFIRKKNRFSNPVGSTIYSGLKGLVAELFEGMDQDKLKSFLDPIVRTRAVQDFSPSDAAAFPLSLKTVIRKMVAKDIKSDPNLASALLEFETRIDTLCLLSFDIYSACREKIYELKENDVRNRTFSAFKRANLIQEDHG